MIGVPQRIARSVGSRVRKTAGQIAQREGPGAGPREVECPAGQQTGPPDFVGIGVQRCGTTWWFVRLMQHPQSHHSKDHRKERHFFDRYWQLPFGDEDVAAYHRQFPRPPGSITGEWTPRYLHDFWALPLVVRSAPEAKLLVMLRDPFERYVSGLARAMAMDKFGRKTTLAQDSLSRCYYHSQLRTLLDLVPREQVKVLQFERCIAEPAEQYRSTLEFLGYDDTSYVPDDLAEPLNSTRNAKPVVPDHVRARIVELLEPDVRSLAADFGDDIDISLWRSFSHLAG